MTTPPWVVKKLRVQWEKTKRRNTPDCMVSPVKENDLRVWRGFVRSETGDMHSFEMRFSSKYPLEPPEVEWLTPISHPNIEPPKPQGLGRVCYPPITQPSEWSPNTSIDTVIEGLRFVLNNPNPADPLMHPSCLEVAIQSIERQLSSSNLPQERRSQATSMLSSAKTILRQAVGRPSEQAHSLVKQAAALAWIVAKK